MSDLCEALCLFITNTGRRSQLDIGGELDCATVGAVRDHLELLVESGTGDVDVDMALVTFCDAATLSVLVTVHHQLAALDRHLRVINASRPVIRLLELTALNTMLLDSPNNAGTSLDSCREHRRSFPTPHRRARRTRNE